MPAYIRTSDAARPLRGDFTMRVLDKDGNVIETFEDHNMIVDLARVAMSRLVGEGDVTKVIKRFGVGTNQLTATPADTELENPYVNDITGVDYPENGTVRFSWKLGYNEANEKNVTEFALFCDDGSMFSRKVRAPIYKASDIAFEGEWSIIF